MSAVLLIMAGIVGFLLNSPRDGVRDLISLGGKITTSRYQCQTATTTPDYLLTTSATSTCTVSDMGSVGKADFNVMLKASSTASALIYAVYGSNDSDTATRNWFEITNSEWAPGSAANSSTYKTINLTNLSAKYLKVDTGVRGANGAVYSEIISQETF